MTTRRQFLKTVAERLERGIPKNPIRPMFDVPNEPIDYTVDLSRSAASFIAAAGAVGTEVVETTEAQLPTMVLDLVRELGAAATLAATDEPICAAITDQLQESGIRLAPDLTPATLSETTLGISGARAGVALTGSIAIDSSVPGARVVSLLPEVHLAILRATDIVPDPGSVLRTLDSDLLPSNLVFVTGPSRSADIELRLTIGVHGPGRLIVALI